MAWPDWEVGDLLTADEMNDRRRKVVYKTAFEQVTSSTVLQDDDELTLPVTAGYIYVLRAQIFYSGATTGDIKIAWSTPASTSMWWATTGYDETAAAHGAVVRSQFASLPTTERPHGAVGTGGNATHLSVNGVVIINTTGNFTLQWAQRVADATATSVREASHLILEPIRRS